jgi:hypothetical protein
MWPETTKGSDLQHTPVVLDTSLWCTHGGAWVLQLHGWRPGGLPVTRRRSASPSWRDGELVGVLLSMSAEAEQCQRGVEAAVPCSREVGKAAALCSGARAPDMCVR